MVKSSKLYTGKLSLVTLCFAICATFSYAEKIKVYDLGVVGKTTPVNVETIVEENQRYLQSLRTRPDYKKTQQILEKVKSSQLSFHTTLPKHSGKPRKRTKTLKTIVQLPLGAKMLFFTCGDTIPQNMAKNISYGYCLGYSSLQDIEAFREGNKIKFPVQPLLSDKICEWFGLTSLPAIITIKGAELEIQEGF